MTKVRQIARAAAVLLAVVGFVLPPRADGTIPRSDLRTAALLSHSAPLAASQSGQHPSSPAAVLTQSEAAVSGMCRNDPVNNFDPLGLAPGDGGGNPIAMGPGFDFYPVGGWTGWQLDFEHRTMSGFEAGARGIVYSPLIAMRLAAIPAELTACQYAANYQYMGSHYDAVNMTFNPLWLVISGEEELRTGRGLNWYNAGQALTGEQKCESGFNMALGGIQTALIAVPIGRAAAGSEFGRTLTIMAEKGGSIPCRQASQIAALSQFLETATPQSGSLRALVAAPIHTWAENVTLPQVRRAAIQGRTFELSARWGVRQVQDNVVEQITLQTPSGLRPRIDFVGFEAGTRVIALTEAKSSLAAPLTDVQLPAFAEIETLGAVVVGQGKPPFTGGTVIPPTRVFIIRAPR